MSTRVCKAPRTPTKAEFCMSTDRKHSCASRRAGLAPETRREPRGANASWPLFSVSRLMALVLCSDFYVSGSTFHTSTDGICSAQTSQPQPSKRKGSECNRPAWGNNQGAEAPGSASQAERRSAFLCAQAERVMVRMQLSPGRARGRGTKDPQLMLM